VQRDDAGRTRPSPPARQRAPLTRTPCSADPRSAGLAHLIRVLAPDDGLPDARLPRWVLLENVKGFHGAVMHARFRDALRARGFSLRQFLASPAQCGVPNNRTRFYLLAERSARWAGVDPGAASLAMPSRAEAEAELRVLRGAGPEDRSAPRCVGAALPAVLRARGRGSRCGMPGRDAKRPRPADDGSVGAAEADATDGGSGEAATAAHTRPIGEFVEELGAAAAAELLLSREMLEKGWAKGLSYVGVHDKTTFCFTGSYGKVRALSVRLLNLSRFLVVVAKHVALLIVVMKRVSLSRALSLRCSTSRAALSFTWTRASRSRRSRSTGRTCCRSSTPPQTSNLSRMVD